MDRRTLRPNDIVFETAGGNRDRPTGRSVLVKARLLGDLKLPATCASFARFLRVDPAKADPQYVFWYLQHLYQQGTMWVHQVQHTGVARFQYTRFAETQRIPLPPLREQAGIARILGALDDKIELNRGMNQTLEATARAIFKSWFVDFDPVRAKRDGRQPTGMDAETAALFPDHFECAESGAAKIPHGWHWGRLDDLLLLQRGFDLPADQRTPGPYPVFSAGGKHGSHREFKVRGPGVVTGRSGVLGNIFYIHDDFWPLNTTLWVKEFRRSRPIHAYHLLSDLGFRDFNAGSAVPTLNRNHVHGLQVVVPPMALVERFEALASPQFARCEANRRESQTLSLIRDALLPKLLSGEIHVRDAEKVVEGAV